MVFGSQYEIIALPLQLHHRLPSWLRLPQITQYWSKVRHLLFLAPGLSSLQRDLLWKSSLFLPEYNNRGIAAVRSIIHRSKGRGDKSVLFLGIFTSPALLPHRSACQSSNSPTAIPKKQNFKQRGCSGLLTPGLVTFYHSPVLGRA